MAIEGRAANARVGIFDSIPAALRHYEEQLAQTLQSAGAARPGHAPAPNAEVRDLSRVRRVMRATQFATAPRHGDMRQFDLLIDLWPTFGLLEPVLWRGPLTPTRVAMIYHDPTPMRSQVGFGRLSRWLGLVALDSRHSLIVHTGEAAEVLAAMGWPHPHVLRHPILEPPKLASRLRHTRVLVAGQFKGSRDLGLLQELAPFLSAAGVRGLIAGLNWPPIDGWDYLPGFIDENDLSELLSSSMCVLIPYRHFFASNIGMRALEAGTGVVLAANAHSLDVWGTDWPGLVGVGAPASVWAAAIAAVADVSPDRITEVRQTYARQAARDWGSFLSQALPD